MSGLRWLSHGISWAALSLFSPGVQTVQNQVGLWRANPSTLLLVPHPSEPPDTGEAARRTELKSRTLVSLSGSSKTGETLEPGKPAPTCLSTHRLVGFLFFVCLIVFFLFLFLFCLFLFVFFFRNLSFRFARR